MGRLQAVTDVTSYGTYNSAENTSRTLAEPPHLAPSDKIIQYAKGLGGPSDLVRKQSSGLPGWDDVENFYLI